MRHLVTCLLVASLVAACDGGNGAARITTQDVNVTTPEDTAISVTVAAQANVQNIDAEVSTQPSHGTVTSAGSTYTYTPAADFSGTDTLEVTFTSGGETAVAAVNITVTPVNDAPVAGPDSFAGAFGSNVAIQTSALLENDSDKDSTTLSVTAVTAGTHGTLAQEGETITFTPEANYQGAATFMYTLSDGMAASQGLVTVTIGNNNAPVAVADSATTPEDAVLTIPRATLLANDTDADHQQLMLTAVGGGSHGTAVIQGTNVVFSPEPDYFGAASFTYSVTDGADTATATVAVTVTPVNDAPVANDDVATTAEDTPINLTAATLADNDTDVDSANLTVTAVGGATNGTVVLANGVATFTPAANFNGAASFTYTLSDGQATDTGTVSITVTPVNDPPLAVDDVITDAEDTVISIAAATLVANDVDVEGDTKTLVSIGAPSVGTAVLASGAITFTPPANFNGVATFNYLVSDGQATDVGAVMVIVTPVNDAPVANADVATTDEDKAVTINVVSNDIDVDGDVLMIMSTSPAAHGVVTFSGGNAQYTPAANFNGQDAFTYVVRDAAGVTATASVVVTVLPVQDPPTAGPDSLVTAEDVSGSVSPLANDSDPDGDTLTLISVTGATHGTAVQTGNQVTYTPAPNYFGADSVAYTVSDGQGNTATGTIAITVTPVNDAPTPVNDTYTFASGTTLTVDAASSVLINDTDIDNASLTAILNSQPSHGNLTFQVDGTFTYSSTDPFATSDSFTYFASDGMAQTLATVSIVINQAPCASDDWYTFYVGDSDGSFSSVLNNDFDEESDPLTPTLSSPPEYANTFAFNPDGTFTYTPDLNALPSSTYNYDYFYYDVTDGYSTVEAIQVEIEIYDPNQCQKCGPSTLTHRLKSSFDRDIVFDQPTRTFEQISMCYCRGLQLGLIEAPVNSNVIAGGFCTFTDDLDAVRSTAVPTEASL